ncbi:MAG: HEAT repeat domain-containing protein [Planctomycetaceae bacterium]|nr:HEAT repeat domain-containing protein [Planctomycetaceae bacterium]
MKRITTALFIILATGFAIHSNGAAAELKLNKGDHICLVGNELGERMQHHNHWEALLHHSHPDLDLTVRNLCFPGDEPFERIRSLDFGDPDSHLTHSQADVVMYFFGFNESFKGDNGLAEFAEQMERLVRETQQKNYSGKANARVVLVSPIAFENIGNPNVTDGSVQNANLQKYTAVLKQVAEDTGAAFADIYSPTKALFEQSDQQLTLNGSHLNDAGYKALAPILLKALGLSVSNSPVPAQLYAELKDKNFHWWHRYRAVNGYSIYGKRGLAGTDGTHNNREVMERERAILDQMTANRDQRVWAIAKGQSVSDVCDDSNTLPFLDVKTNVGGEDDKNAKAGKLGSLDYLPAAEQQKKFKLADGYEIQLVASEEDFPELANPVALNFDNKGRLWVSTMPSYPHWQPKTKLDDKVLILEDNNGDGRADKCTVFADGLHQPTGFEIGYGGAWVAQQPDILFLQDTDGDDVADVRVRKLVGFDSADSHHGISAFEWSPGGTLHFNEGTFKYSQVESPYGLTRMHEAGVWRYNPRTEEFGTHVSLAFANPWGHVYDFWGQDFISDASPGFNYWATPISGKVNYPAKHAGGSFNDSVNNFKDTALRGRDVYPTFITKRTRPSAGSEIVSSRHFKPQDQGDFLLCNVITDRSILQHSLTETESGFEGKEKPPLVFCEDGNFRPIDIQFAPDGTLYICDWHNALIGHLQHNLREPNRDHQHGRIWRVVCKDRPLVKAPAIAGEPLPALLDALKEYEDRTRYRARRELAERSTADVTAAVKDWINGLNASDQNHSHHLLEAAWVLQSHNVADVELLHSILNADDYHCRAAATRVLCDLRNKVPDALKLIHERINDEHPRVRLEAVRACSFFSPDEAIEVALDVLNHDVDQYLQYTLDETMRHLESL